MTGRRMSEKAIFRDAEAGDPYAGLGLAYMYHHGKNIDPDNELALKWYIRSSDAGCSRAKWELAKIFREGVIAKKDEEKAAHYLAEAAASGVSEAKLELGMAYLDGVCPKKNMKEAFRLIHSAACQGNLMAQFITGYMYGKGIGVQQDLSEREKWYTRTGLAGDGDLFYLIGRNFEYGLMNIEEDLFEAGRWYKMGADMGHEKCIICWRSVLSTLDDCRQDTIEEREAKLRDTGVEKEKLVREAALAAADRFLEEGEEEGAFVNYKKAADLGSPDAMFTLAMMYHNGIFVKRNDRISLELLQKASLGGSEDAQFMLGTLYEEGKGLKKNLDEALRFYTMAAANGYLTAFYRLSLYMEHPEVHVKNSAVAVR